MAKNQKREKSKKDIVFLILLVPVSVVILVVLYTLLNQIAEKNEKVCKYIGNIWLYELATPNNPESRIGCYTWEEVYK